MHNHMYLNKCYATDKIPLHICEKKINIGDVYFFNQKKACCRELRLYD
jgi:hypothetical protein